MADTDDDAWGFLPKREGLVPQVENVEKRARGELRGEMVAVSLKRRAWPIALSLALISVAGLLTDVVATSHLLSVAGPRSLAYIFPLGGICLLLVAGVQFRIVDNKARLPVLRSVIVGYGTLFLLALALVVSSVAESIATGALVLLADQLNFLAPLLIWSIAGDEFNVAEGRKVFGWIISWTYGGQILGLVISVLSPQVLTSLDIQLPYVLFLVPVATIFVGFWLPYVLRNSATTTSIKKEETSSESLKSAWEFIQGVPVWRAFLVSSLLTFAAGMTAMLVYFKGVEKIFSDDPAALQRHVGGVTLVSFLVCFLLQRYVAEKFQEKFGIPVMLFVLPIAAVIAGITLSVGIGGNSIWVILVGISIWLIPRWSIDENARRGALALVPDEKRTRVSFLVDLGPIAFGLIAAAPLGALGAAIGADWISPTAAAIVGSVALPFAFIVRRDWEASLLNWRLRRRKQNRVIDF